MSNGIFPLTSNSYYDPSRSIYIKGNGNLEERMWGVFLRTEKILKGFVQKWQIIVIFHRHDWNNKYIIEKLLFKINNNHSGIKFPREKKKFNLAVNFLLVQRIHGILIMQKDMCVPSHAQLFVIPWTAICHAALSMGFSWQEYWSRLPFLTPGDLPNLGMETASH